MILHLLFELLCDTFHIFCLRPKLAGIAGLNPAEVMSVCLL